MTIKKYSIYRYHDGSYFFFYEEGNSWTAPGVYIETQKAGIAAYPILGKYEPSTDYGDIFTLE